LKNYDLTFIEFEWWRVANVYMGS